MKTNNSYKELVSYFNMLDKKGFINNSEPSIGFIQDLKKIVDTIRETKQLNHHGIVDKMKPFIEKYESFFSMNTPENSIYFSTSEIYKEINRAINENRENTYSRRKVIAEELENILKS